MIGEVQGTAQYTFLADVFGLEVSEKVFLARMKIVQHGVWDGDDAVSPAGALAVDVMQHVRPAADLVVGRQALSLHLVVVDVTW